MTDDVKDWNQRYPAGTPVKALLRDGTVVEAVTNSGAWQDPGDAPKIEILLRRAGLAETDSGRRQLPLDRVHVLAPLPILKDWNNRYPAGTAVTYTLDDGRMIDTVTRSEAWRLADGSAVILIKGQSGAVAFERVHVRKVSEVNSGQDQAYKERDMCVALIARMALALGYRVWLAQHPDADWEDDWRTIVYIDLPTGQVSWHIHDSEREWFLRDLHYNSNPDLIWDGHDTAEKYRRVLEYSPPTSVEQKTEETQEQKWEAYLRSLGADETLPTKQRQCVLNTWLRIVKAQPRVMKPTAGLDEKGNFYFGWNPGDRSLDIEIDQDGKLDWFFVNHATGLRIGAESLDRFDLNFLPVASAHQDSSVNSQDHVSNDGRQGSDEQLKQGGLIPAAKSTQAARPAGVIPSAPTKQHTCVTSANTLDGRPLPPCEACQEYWSSKAFRRYLEIVDELISKRAKCAAQGTLSDDEEERFAIALSDCRTDMTEQDQERLNGLLAARLQPYPLAAQYERRLVQYVNENDRLKSQVTELQARMTRMVEEHRVALASNAKPVAGESQGNAINHPAHYNTGKIEVIVAIEDWKLGFNLGNTVKYVARAGKKNPNAVLEDLRKAHWYLEREIEGLEQR